MRLIASALLPLMLASCGSGDNSEPAVTTNMSPNFVIIIADDLGWNDVSAYGSDFAHTPNIDQLASDGVRFTNAFLTSSSCSASRASILTGKYPQSNGLIHLHQSLPPDQKLVSHWLSEAGYYTASIGKWHIGRTAKSQFDRVIEERGDPDTAKWIQALRDRPREQPFFFWLASRDPHRPHDGGVQFGKHYQGDALRLPQGFIDGPGVREEWLAYFQEVSRFDYDVGRVLDELNQQGVADNTVVIIMSDNGRPFLRGKTWLYDDSIKTPFIVFWPKGMGSAGEYHGLISALDIAPTMLELAGQSIPTDMQGESFAAVLADREKRIRNEVFAVRNWHGGNAHERAVRTTQYLYKENQHLLYGDCLKGGFGSSPSTQVLREAYLRGAA
jgi:N-sulfoglucosamine sulfohydrolase